MTSGGKQYFAVPVTTSDTFITYPVIDAQITGTNNSAALETVINQAESSDGGYACFVNAHVTVMTRQDERVRSAVNNATYAFPDGMPVYLIGKYLQGLDIEKISGPDVMAMMFENERGRSLRHFFYGATEEVLEKLVASLEIRYPGCNIVGAVSPPFRQLTKEEHAADLAAIRDADAQIVWVGLGAPKQELWMQANTDQLPDAMLMGVGAAFDFHAGMIERAPEWMQTWGLEWVHRLAQEPKRLWKRYLVTNTLFVYLAVRTQLTHSLLRMRT
jgi:N-acetylglucosaminyldiphosphoundecaprenol N-acetyl-beta-D-mannosaminyltransferase